MAEEREPFSATKLVKGFVNPVTWSKSIVYAAMIAILVFGAFTIYRAYFMKTGSNINKPNTDNTVVVTPWSKVGDINQETTVTNTQKTETVKRAWWIPHLYSGVAFSGKVKTDGSSVNLKSFQGEARADILGLRWDWN